MGSVMGCGRESSWVECGVMGLLWVVYGVWNGG